MKQDLEYVAIVNGGIPPLPRDESFREWLHLGDVKNLPDGAALSPVSHGSGPDQVLLFIVVRPSQHQLLMEQLLVKLEQLPLLFPNLLVRAITVDKNGLRRVLIEYGTNAARPELRTCAKEVATC